MRDLLERAIETARVRGAAYADARHVHRRQEDLTVRTGRVEAASASESEGIGIRVLVDGAWGFAATSFLEPAEVDRAADLAVRIARASA